MSGPASRNTSCCGGVSNTMKRSTFFILVATAVAGLGLFAMSSSNSGTTEPSAGPLPEGWFQSLDRDAILPVYDPTFEEASDVHWPRDALVIGVEVGGDARAYPVAFLNRREMVNDVVGGEPLLVSW